MSFVEKKNVRVRYIERVYISFPKTERFKAADSLGENLASEMHSSTLITGTKNMRREWCVKNKSLKSKILSDMSLVGFFSSFIKWKVHVHTVKDVDSDMPCQNSRILGFWNEHCWLHLATPATSWSSAVIHTSELHFHVFHRFSTYCDLWSIRQLNPVIPLGTK